MSYSIYVAGPIMAPNPYHPEGLVTEELLKQRRAKFGQVAGLMRRQVGSATTVVNPLDIPACDPTTNGPKCAGVENGPYGRGHSWQCFLRYDLATLLMCDEITMLEGWEGPPGSTVEFNVANMIGLEVTFWCDLCQRTESDGPCSKKEKK